MARLKKTGFSTLRTLHPLDWLLPAAPLALAIRFVPTWNHPTWLFFISGLAIIPLARWISVATENLAERTGAGIGGLLNATLGNAPELIISLVALSKGLTEVVKASIIGSILGNILGMLGLAILAGGLRFHHLRFNQTGNRAAATSLCLAVIGLMIPTVFHLSGGVPAGKLSSHTVQNLSVVVALALLATYGLWLVFALRTHAELFAGQSAEAAAPEKGDVERPAWPLAKALLVLAAATTLIAILSECFAGSVEAACQSLGLTEVFVGIIVIAIVGNASELTAVMVARKGKMDLSLSVTIGASAQIALFVTPLLVLASHGLGTPMTLEFSLPEIASLAVAVGIVVLISGDGECNWVEGAQLLAVYFMIATLFFFLPEPPSPSERAAAKAPASAPASARP